MHKEECSKYNCHAWIIYMTKKKLKDLKWSGHLIREATCWKTKRRRRGGMLVDFDMNWLAYFEKQRKKVLSCFLLRSHSLRSFTLFLFLMYNTAHIVILWFFLFRLFILLVKYFHDQMHLLQHFQVFFSSYNFIKKTATQDDTQIKTKTIWH